MVKRVGLTGGIGSGKSTVAQMFQDIGIETIDADKIARELCQPGQPQFIEITRAFGPEILDRNGFLDRKVLGEIIFSDIKKRKLLESILHPAIRTEMWRISDKSKSRYCILEIPLLLETAQHKRMDSVIVVTCNIKIRIARLIESRDLSYEQIRNIIETQMSDQERQGNANYVIQNNSDLKKLKVRVNQIHLDLTKKWSE